MLSATALCKWRAALSYYFVMALFPALIFLSAIVAFLPVAGLFDQTLDLMGRFVPTEGMGIVRKVLSDAVTPNRGTFLSIGFVGTLWTASGGFAAAIEALNVAYDVDETRPFWKTRLLAILLAIVIGFLLLVALSIMIVGPHFGAVVGCSSVFVASVVVELALSSLAHFGQLHHSCSRDSLFFGTECKAAFLGNIARRNSLCGFLDRLFLPAGYLFQDVRKL